jgi:PAS domain S-box-containing protein
MAADSTGAGVIPSAVVENTTLGRSSDHFAKLFRASPWFIAVTDMEDTRILDLNPAFAQFLGYSPEELIGRKVLDIGLWVSETERLDFRAKIVSQGRVTGYEVHWRNRHDQSLYCMVGSEIVELDGRACLFTSAVDITQHRAAVEALRESEARYRTLIDSAPEAIVVLDAETAEFVDANEHASQLFGRGREDLFKTGPAALSPPTQPGGKSSPESARDRIAEALSGQRPVFEWIHLKASGEPFTCEVRLVALPARNRKLVRASVFDISERKRIEKEALELQTRLEQTQRLEALGTLAGGVAHDFNNILGAIIGYTDLAMMELGDGSPTRALLENVERGATRAVDLVRQILAFSRQTPQDRKPVQPAFIVKEALKLLRATLPATIVVKEIRESSGWVLADPGQLHQIVMNLCTNAGLAMRDAGGELEVAVRERMSDAALLRRHPDLNPGRYLCLSVSDTGCGIPPENLDRIFEPFFSTRPKGLGTGLGLSVVHGIVKSCAGAIQVTSAVGQGSKFEVLLPAIDAGAKVEPIQPESRKGSARVMFVDDEIDLTEVARQGLTRYGYSVTPFNNPLDALAVFRARPSEFDVVVTDMTMPRLTGDLLAAEIKRLRPEIPIILVSGFSDRITPEQAKEAGFDGFVDKPLRPTTLAGIIGRLCRYRDPSAGT